MATTNLWKTDLPKIWTKQCKAIPAVWCLASTWSKTVNCHRSWPLIFHISPSWHIKIRILVTQSENLSWSGFYGSTEGCYLWTLGPTLASSLGLEAQSLTPENLQPECPQSFRTRPEWLCLAPAIEGMLYAQRGHNNARTPWISQSVTVGLVERIWTVPEPY